MSCRSRCGAWRDARWFRSRVASVELEAGAQTEHPCRDAPCDVDKQCCED